MAVWALLVVPATILTLTSVAAVLPEGLAGLSNAGPHGFLELLYAYTSTAATNGSAFAGPNANTTFFNQTLVGSHARIFCRYRTHLHRIIRAERLRS
jgi:potassium-transporting ATPase potassium-binding subunit